MLERLQPLPEEEGTMRKMQHGATPCNIAQNQIFKRCLVNNLRNDQSEVLHDLSRSRILDGHSDFLRSLRHVAGALELNGDQRHIVRKLARAAEVINGTEHDIQHELRAVI